MKRLPLLPLLALVAAGCTTTHPPEPYPDLVTADTPPDSLCTVRESDHCFIGSIDDRYVTQYDVNVYNPGTYRQFQLPPGTHTIAVFYRWQRNLETVTAGPRFLTLDAQPGATYTLRANVNGADAPFADTLNTANWRPSLTNDATRQEVAQADINR